MKRVSNISRRRRTAQSDGSADYAAKRVELLRIATKLFKERGFQSTKLGEGLAKTTGWIRRTLLKKRGVAMLSGVEYVRIDDAGLHVRIDGKPQVLAVDTVVICAGQEPRRDIVDGLAAAGIRHQVIGGADVAAELDARRAVQKRRKS